jgi:predicted enzyme related to lactoylglutathione lyase
MGNKVVHFELNGPDPAKAAAFYAELFGWHTNVWTGAEGDYTLVDTHAGSGINGGIGKSQDDRAWTTVYVDAPDPQAILDKAESLGGKVVMPVTDMSMVTLGMFADPDGNILGAVKSSEPGQEGPGVSEGDGKPVDWFEVLGPNPKDLWAFYSQLFGWSIKEGNMGDFVYGQVSSDEVGIGGGIGSTFDGQGHVNVYAQVDDLHKYLERAEALGGKRMSEPQKVDDHTSIAHLTDPQGTWFGLYTYSE